MHAPVARGRSFDSSSLVFTDPPIISSTLAFAMPSQSQKVVQYKHMSLVEKGLIEQWTDEGIAPTEIAERLERDLSTIARQVTRLEMSDRERAKLRPVGQPKSLSPKDIDRLVLKTQLMTKASDARHQVTANMIKRAAGLTCSDKTVIEALHERNIWFRPLREKPVRTDDDVKDRFAFGKKYAPKSVKFWHDIVYIDNKMFTLYLTPRTRAYASKRVARGSFRTKGGGLAKGHVKPKKNLKYNTGARSVQVTVAISAKKVVIFHIVRGNWNATKAAIMYTKLASTLKKGNPRKRHFTVLEDNDPTGYKSI